MTISFPKDANRIAVLGGVSSADGTTPVLPWVDPSTHRLLVDNASTSGTVTSVSQGTGILLSTNPITTTGSVSLATSLQPMVTLAGNALKYLRVNAGETAVEYATVAAGGITIGTTTITSGTNTRILYNNAGVVGEYTLTGSGTVVVMQNTPTLTTPVLGVATATSINKVAITAPATSATLTIADGKTFTVSNTLTLAGTDSTVMTFPTTSATIARTDAGQTFTGVNTMTSPVMVTSIDTSSTSFTAFAGATTLMTIGGTGASASSFFPSTLDTSSSITGAIRTSGGISAAKSANIGTTLTVGTGYQIAGAAASNKILKGNGTNFVASTETYAAPGTSGNVMTSDGTNWTSAAPSGVTTVVTMMPDCAIHPYQNSAPVAQNLNTNTTMFIGQVWIPYKITANKISIVSINNGGTNGTLDLTMYSEDGQTQLFSVTTASINASANVLTTTALSAVVINPGIYYIAANPNSTATISTYFYNTSNAVWGTSLSVGLPGYVSSEPVMQGTLTITAGTPPATIDPTAITFTDTTTLIFRLDN